MNVVRILITLFFLVPQFADARHLQIHGHKKISIPPVVFLEVDTHKCESPCTVNFKVRSLLPERLIGDISHYVFDPDDGSEERIMTSSEFFHIYEHIAQTTHNSNHHKYKRGKRKGYGNDKKKNKDFKNFKPKVYAVTVDGVRGPSSMRVIRVKAGETSEPENLAPVASFLAPARVYLNEVFTATSNSIDPDNHLPLVYEWTSSDGRVFEGDQINMAFAQVGGASLSLKVTDALGASSSFVQNIEVVAPSEGGDDTKPATSAASVAFNGINQKSFNARNLEVRVAITGAEFLNDIGSMKFYLNSGLGVHASALTQTEAIFHITAEDGENNLEFYGVDSENLPIYSSINFWAGDRSLTVKAQESTGEQWIGNGEASVRLLDNENVSATVTMVGGSGILENLPSNGLLATVQTAGAGFGFLEELPAEGEAVVTLLPRRLPSDIDNNDFSQGVGGWEIVGGETQLVSHSEEGIFYPDNQDLELSTGLGKSVQVGRTVVVDPSAHAFGVRFKAHLSNSLSSGILILRNETSGEVKYIKLNKKKALDGLVWLNFGITASEGDIIHFDAFMTNLVEGESSWLNRHGIFDEVWAQDSSLPSSLIFDNISASSFVIYEADLSQWFYEYIGGVYALERGRKFTGEFSHLSVGESPGENILPHNRNDIYARIVAQGNFQSVVGMELVLEQRANGNLVRVVLPSDLLPANNTTAFTSGNFYDFFYLSGSESGMFSTRDTDLINGYLNVRLSNGNVQSYIVSNAIGLVPLLWRDEPSNRYGSELRDFEIGGDSWVRQSVSNLLSESDWRSFVDSIGFRYGDISKLNGGHFPGHKEHQDGRDLDFIISGLIGGGDERERYLSARAIEQLAHGFSSLEFPNFPMRVEKILGAYSRDEGNNTDAPRKGVNKEDYRKYSTEIYKNIRAKCSNDYRLLPDIMRNEPEHYNHLHARFYKEGEGVPALSVANPQDFLLSFRHIDEADGSMVLEVQPNEAGWNKYFWEIYQVNIDGLELIDVIDDKHMLGATANQAENLPSERAIVDDYTNPRVITYRFTPGQEYVVSLVGVQRNGEGLSFNADEASVDRCVRKQYRFTAPRTLVCGGAPVFLSQNDQVRPAPVGSLHQNYAGVFKGDNVSVDENALIQSDGAARFCAGTIIEGSGGTSGTPASSVVGEEEIKPALRMAGEVELANTHVDLNDGRLVLAGQEDILGLPQPNDPDFYNQYVVNRTLIQNSVIRPTQDREIGIVNSWIWGNSLITDDADIQTSAITNSEVRDNAFVGGTTVTAVQEASEEGRIARVTIAGTSIVYGAVYTLDNLLIENSGLADKSRVSGQVSIRDSVIDGMVSADENIVGEGERVAEITAKSYIGPKGSLSGRVYMNQGGLDAGDESPDRLPSVAGGSASIYQATLNDGASVEGNTELLGSRILFRNSSAWDNASFNSEACDGTGSFLDVNGNSIVFGSARMCGTATISGVHMFDTATVNDNAQVFFSRVQHNGSISGKATVVGNSLDSMLQVGGNAKVLGEAVVTGFSSITGTANLFGTVRVHNCRLINGFYGSGNINPTMENSPCLNASSSMATLAFAAQTIGADTSMLVDSSNEEVSDSSLSAMEFQASTVEMKAQQAKKPINKKLLQRYASHLREEARRIASIREARISKNVAKLGRARSSSQKKMSVESFDRMRDGYRQHARQRMQEMRDQAEIYRSYMKVKQD